MHVCGEDCPLFLSECMVDSGSIHALSVAFIHVPQGCLVASIPSSSYRFQQYVPERRRTIRDAAVPHHSNYDKFLTEGFQNGYMRIRKSNPLFVILAAINVRELSMNADPPRACANRSSSSFFCIKSSSIGELVDYWICIPGFVSIGAIIATENERFSSRNSALVYSTGLLKQRKLQMPRNMAAAEKPESDRLLLKKPRVVGRRKW